MLFDTVKSIREAPLARLLMPFHKQLGLLVFISAVTNVLMLTPTLYMLQIFDRLMISQSMVSLAILSLITVGLYALQAFSEWLRTKVIVATGICIDGVINRPLFYSTMTPSLGEKGQNPAQSLSDLMTIRQWLTGSGLYAFLDAPWAPFYVAIMFVMHPVLGWFSVSSILILAAVAAYATLKSAASAEATSEEDRELNRFLFHNLRNADVIEAHGMVPNFYRQWWAKQVSFLHTQSIASDQEERLTSSSKQIKVFLTSLSIAVGAILAIEGEITMGAMIAAGLLASRATAPVDSFVFGWKGFISVKQAYLRLKSQLKSEQYMASDSGYEPTHTEDQEPVVPEVPLSLDISLVSLKHPNDSRNLLTDLTFNLKSGQCLVILGPSGVGKSSLAKLLVGLLPPDDGRVLIGSYSAHKLTQSMRRSTIGFLSQESELFEDSIAKNISGMGDSVPSQVIQSASDLDIHSTILKLEKGYDTFITEQDGVLSGGQRQRLALARAFYGDPSLIVLDEPNSNLDSAGELALKNAVIKAKGRGAMVVIVSHRRSMFDVAEKLLVLEEGCIKYLGAPIDYSPDRSVPFN